MRIFKNFERAMENEKLTIMVRESSMIRSRNLEQMIKSGEEKSELYLERHIRD